MDPRRHEGLGTDRCAHLLCKGRFSGDDPSIERPDDPFGNQLDHYYWCARTMDVVGPDGEIASDPVCDPARTCFRRE